MSEKKPFDYIEEKIKQAAENSIPAFDEKAWEAMNAKLDKEEKRRRPFFWWILLPMLAAGGWGLYELSGGSGKIKQQPVITAATGNNENSGDKKASAQTIAATPADKGQSVTAPGNSSVVLPANQTAITLDIKSSENKEDASSVSGKDISANNEHIKNAALVHKRNIVRNKKGGIHATSSAAEVSGNDTEKDEATVVEEPVGVNNGKTKVSAAPLTANTNEPSAINTTKNVTPQTQNSNDKDQPAVKNDAATTDKTPPQPKAEKKKGGTVKGFYLLLAGGTDAGSTKLFSYSNSSITPKYGLGLGYQFSKKLSIQSGFYVSNKKYTAFAGDYHPKAGSYWNRVDIKQVKAACLIYEIPLALRYNIIQKQSYTLFGTAGASSYIMQTEDYNYYYRAYNMPYESTWQYTGNKHLFSNLSFSIGIEKKLSQKFSLLAEPSFSIPVSGVGDGKVRLYSSALLLGLKYLPFNKHN